MNADNLKIFCGKIVTETKLSKEAKLQLLTFIQHEATKHQLMAFMLDGKITKLDEHAEKIVEDRFNASSKLQEIRPLVKTYASVVGGVGSYGIPWLIYRKIRSKTDMCTKKCGTYQLNSIRRQYCMAKCQAVKLQIMIKASKVSAEKSKLQVKLAKALNNVKQYEAKAKASGVDA